MHRRLQHGIVHVLTAEGFAVLKDAARLSDLHGLGGKARSESGNLEILCHGGQLTSMTRERPEEGQLTSVTRQRPEEGQLTPVTRRRPEEGQAESPQQQRRQRESLGGSDQTQGGGGRDVPAASPPTAAASPWRQQHHPGGSIDHEAAACHLKRQPVTPSALTASAALPIVEAAVCARNMALTVRERPKAVDVLQWMAMRVKKGIHRAAAASEIGARRCIIAGKMVLAALSCSQPMFESATVGLGASRSRIGYNRRLDTDEAGYRSWVQSQIAPLLRVWSR